MKGGHEVGAKVVRIRRDKPGALVQGCDVYIGRKVTNGRWNLAPTMWNNLYGDSPEGLLKYEQHIRDSARHWHRLDDLEGMLLGCWCSPSACHGDVLARLLEEKKCEEIRKDLARAGLRLVDGGDVAKIRQAGPWWLEHIWLAHATRLDDSNLYYFESNMFFALESYAGSAPDFWVATSDSKKAVYYIVGLYGGCQPLGPFDIKTKKAKSLESANANVAQIAPKLTLDQLMPTFSEKLTSHLAENSMAYQKAMTLLTVYLRKRRIIAKHVGRALGINMLDHDLTKSRLVQVALAYRFYWPEWAGKEKCKELCHLATAITKKGHYELEDHHRDYEEAENGPLNARKLFADRLTVHLLKDPRDNRGGWAVQDFRIPDDLKPEWEAFRSAYGHINLYVDALEPAHRRILWKRSRFEEDSD